MRLLLFSLFLLLGSCQVDDIVDPDFSCSVDYIEFTASARAIVKLDVTVDGVSDSYYVDSGFTSRGSDYFIGTSTDSLVVIRNFTTKGSSGSLYFEYGSDLGPFCMSLFPNIPMHSHDPFSATVDKVDTGKNVGRWVVRKKSVSK